MKNELVVVTVLGLLALDSSSAPRERQRRDEPVEVVLARVPQKARGRRNPLRDDADAPAAGKKLFVEHCAECHGESAGGSQRGPGLGPLLSRATDGEIFWLIANGVVQRGMPDWSKLPEPQRWQIIAFLRRVNAPK